MSGLYVDADRCVGCGICVRTCANDGIELFSYTSGAGRARRLARQTDGCIYCGLCKDACPVGAITIERDDRAADEGEGFLVVCETDAAGDLVDVGRELLWKANELAAQVDAGVQALVLGCGERDPQGAADQAYAAGADEVTVGWNAGANALDSELAAAQTVAVARELRPAVVLFGATDFGRELAPQVAEQLQTGLTADCTRLEMDRESGLLLQTRPAFGGNLMATIACPARRPQMATVRPGIFPVPEMAIEVPSVPCSEVWRPETCGLVEVLSCEDASSGETVADAEVLVVAGRGVRDKTGLALCERLAGLLGGKLGCTRPLVEQGWLDRSQQVGQTGCSVAPRLLVSVGVSGAVQHLAGMGGAECVVAVNEDADAPIFSAAQYRVVGDCREVLPELIARLEGDSMEGRL